MAHIKQQFPYIQAGLYYRPIIPIRLRYHTIIARYSALVDSGADFNLLHGEIADVLGIDLQHLKTQSIGGIGGKAVGYPYLMDIGIGDTFYQTQVIFSYDISIKGFGILGQSGFFDRFIVEFNRADKTVTLS